MVSKKPRISSCYENFYRNKKDYPTIDNMKFWYLIPIMISLVIFSGCTSANQDEEYKSLVVDTLKTLDPVNEHIIQPYQGMSADELAKMKNFAEQAKNSAEQMTLSDTSKKSREFFILAMNSVQDSVRILEPDIDSASGKIESTAPATNAFIQIKNNLGSAADIIKVSNEKGY